MFVQTNHQHIDTPIKTQKSLTQELLTQQKNDQQQLATELWEVSQKRKELAAKETKIKKALIDMAHNETIVMDKFLFVKEERKGSINYSAIPELFSIDLEQYRKPSIDVWKLNKR